MSSSLILTYHRVVEPAETGQLLEPGMYVTPKTFESHILYLKSHFEVCSLKDLISRRRVVPDPTSSPRCVLTFDDGWSDFYSNVFPLLKRYRVPATVFLPTDFIGSERWFWTDRLAHLIQRSGEAMDFDSIRQDLPEPLRRQLSRVRGSPEAKLDRSIRILKACANEPIEKAISDLSAERGIGADPPGRAFLSWEEVEEMSRSGVVQFGSHAASHRILPALDDEAVRHELGSSRLALTSRRVVDPGFIPFCYPNGNMDKRIVAMVRDAGYGAAVTIMPGWNPHDADPFTLRRVGIHQDMTSNAAMFGCRIAGLI